MLPAQSRAGRIPVVLLLQLGLLVAAVVLYASLRRTAERQTREIGELQIENLRLRKEAQRAVEQARENERERLLAASRPATESPAPQTQIETNPNGIMERTTRLINYLARHPERGIPEMRLLTDVEWAQLTQNADLDTDVGIRNALFGLRQLAQSRWASTYVGPALKSYMAANHGQIPTDAMQLAPYLQQPGNADLLARIQPNTDPDTAATYPFRAPVDVDSWYDIKIAFGPDGVTMYGMASPPYAVVDAVAKYRKASGTEPTSASQLIPYLKDPIPTPVLEDIFIGLRKFPN